MHSTWLTKLIGVNSVADSRERTSTNSEEQRAAAFHELRDRLTRLELVIVGMETKEEAPVELPDSLEYRD